MQANHCTSDAPFVPLRLGERRSAEGAYVWRSLIDSGAIIANGTDAPVESIDPRVSLYASVTRQLPDGSQFYPEQCMTREEALLSYTRWAARAGFQDHLIERSRYLSNHTQRGLYPGLQPYKCNLPTKGNNRCDIHVHKVG